MTGIAPGELRSNERLGQEPKNGAQAKPGQRSTGRLRIQGAPGGASWAYVTLGTTHEDGAIDCKTVI